MIKIPQPTIKNREIDNQRVKKGIEDGLHPILSRILAARPVDPKYTSKELLSMTLKDLDSPFGLVDLDKAIARLLQAFENEEIIGIETDHDCDGQTSHAVIYEALVHYFQYPKEKIRSYIGHRLQEGYGLSEALTERILADEPRPTLIITADNGSSDEHSIKRLKENGIDVIVTDHHEIPVHGIPKSAIAVLNPTREDCQYPDRMIAGCMVAWLLMAALRQALIEKLGRKDIPKLGGLLDFVAVGTVADCVSIAKSKNNRIVVSFGMQIIQQEKRPCWQAIMPKLTLPLRSEDLGFKIGPLLNSDGRLSCAFGSVSYLLAENLTEAKKWIEHLEIQNISRKSIQERITQLGTQQALLQYAAGKTSLTLLLEDGHAGVHGISASRIKDTFGRPTLIFCPKKENNLLLTGSARSIPGLHLKKALQLVKEMHPDIIEKYGGHEGAAGLTIYRSDFDVFTHCFEEVVRQQVSPEMLGPVIWSDGHLEQVYLNCDFIESLLQQLEPFGREFEPPQFEATAEIMKLQFMGEKKNHARLNFKVDNIYMNGVWFFCREDENDILPVTVGDRVKIVYTPKTETFRGTRRLVSFINHCEKL